jgi:hypothetical protein
VVVVALAVACAACTHRATTAAGQGAAAAAFPDGAPAATLTSAPPASMSSGTAFEDGVLLSWCTAKSPCTPLQHAAPAFVPGDGNGVVLFELGAKPDAARVEVRTTAGALVARADVLAGTTIAYQTRLGDGRFVITLAARWGAREGRWLFGVDGPLGGATKS